MDNENYRVDYRRFRFRRLNTDEFRHLYLLLFWPIYGILFFCLERVRTVHYYHLMHCWLDDIIPFQEWFLIPYLFWFIFLGGMVVYTLFFDVPAFKRMMRFVIITHSVALIIFYLFPNGQNLRPTVFPRDNALTQFIAAFYSFDTSTNVCPSLHVIGSFASLFAGWDSRRFSTRGWRIAFTVTTVLISISTVFLKQHSVLDLLVAMPICACGYMMVYVVDRASVTVPRRLGA
jgi:multisubunit Na+/H+ antiporter MnhC subunit